MARIYSRSYGITENDGRPRQSLKVPPDYNGNVYPRQEEEPPKPQISEAPSAVKEPSPEAPMPAEEKETPSAPQRESAAGGLFDKISVDDLIVFGLLLSLSSDPKNNVSFLAVLMAMLLS